MVVAYSRAEQRVEHLVHGDRLRGQTARRGVEHQGRRRGRAAAGALQLPDGQERVSRRPPSLPLTIPILCITTPSSGWSGASGCRGSRAAGSAGVAASRVCVYMLCVCAWSRLTSNPPDRPGPERCCSETDPS